MNIERIELGNGDWWEIRTVVTRGMRKAFRSAGLRSALGALVGNGVDLQDSAGVTKALLANPGAIDLDAVDDAYLLAGSVAWSWPELISQAAIDQRDDAHTAKVLGRMKAIYAEPTRAELKN